MPLTISCSSCGAQLHLPEDLLATTVRCPSCQHTFTAEAPPSPAPPTASAGDVGVQLGPSKSEPSRRMPEEDEDNRYDYRRGPSYYGGNYAPGRGGLVFGLGIASLLSSTVGACILSFLVGPIAVGLGIPAWLMGQRDLRAIRDGRMDPSAEGMTKAGWIMGIIGTIVGSLIIVACVAYLGFLAVMIANAK